MKNWLILDKIEPTDIRYNNKNYQITEGDKENVQNRRRVISKGASFSEIRKISNIVELLLKATLEKKSLRSDTNTILLIDVMSTGGRNWNDLENEVSTWAKKNPSLCNCWEEIYLVYKDKNIKINL